MENEKKKEFWSKIFGTKKSNCCNLRIEEVIEEKNKEPESKSDEDNNVSGNKSDNGTGSCSCGPGCCGG